MRLIEAILAIASGWAVWSLIGVGQSDDLQRIVGVFAAVSATLLGFMIAALSILTAVVNRRVVVKLRKTGHYDNLLTDLYWTCAAYLATMVTSLVGLFLAGEWLLRIVSVTTSLMVFSTFLFIASGRKFTIVMRLIK